MLWEGERASSEGDTETCDNNCQCDGLITDSFSINAVKRRSGDSCFGIMSNTANSPLTRTLRRSPYLTPTHRAALTNIQNSPAHRSTSKITRIFQERTKFTMENKENQPEFFQTKTFQRESVFSKSETQTSSLGIFQRESALSRSEVTTGSFFDSEVSESCFFKTESSVDSVFGEDTASCMSDSPVGRGDLRRRNLTSWTHAKLSMDSPIMETPTKLEECSRDSGFNSNQKVTSPLLHDERTIDYADLLQTTSRYDDTTDKPSTSKTIDYVPESGTTDIETDFETLHDLEEEFDADNFDKCTNYEIVSTDSPNIISRGSSTRTVTAKNFVFGAPISANEQSTSFNAFRTNPNATRMLNFDDAETSFEFTSPASIRPRNTHNVTVKKALKFTQTPTKNHLRHERSDSSIGSSISNTSPVSHRSEDKTRFRLFNSESTTSMESGFASEIEDAFFEIDSENGNSPKVANFCDLISGQIKDTTLLPVSEETMDLDTESTPNRPCLFRSLSLNPDLDKVRMSLFKSSLSSPSETVVRPFKRPEPPLSGPFEEECKKRRKSNSELMNRVKRPVLQRCLSENAASIMTALNRSESIPDLIADFTQPFALPLTPGQHQDIKSISSDTLASLLRGDFDRTIHDYQVIDCRYPYEFVGGHVRGARNLYTKQQVLSLLEGLQTEAATRGAREHGPDARRRILVFHCEFSQERGPKLFRFLRSTDRAKNKENYPSLEYPEVYLLHEGYSAFYKRHPALCEPCNYTPMSHPQHKTELAVFRAAGEAETSLQRTQSMDERRLQRQRSRSRLLM